MPRRAYAWPKSMKPTHPARVVASRPARPLPRRAHHAVMFALLPAVIIAAGVLGGCSEEPALRTYTASADDLPKVEKSRADALPADPPEHWQALYNRDTLVGRFRSGDDAADPVIEVTRFADYTGTLQADIERWQRQDLRMDAAELAPEQVERMTEQVTIPGGQVTRFHLTSPSPDRQLAALRIDTIGWTWFFKAVGPERRIRAVLEDFDSYISDIQLVTPGDDWKPVEAEADEWGRWQHVEDAALTLALRPLDPQQQRGSDIIAPLHERVGLSPPDDSDAERAYFRLQHGEPLELEGDTDGEEEDRGEALRANLVPESPQRFWLLVMHGPAGPVEARAQVLSDWAGQVTAELQGTAPPDRREAPAPYPTQPESPSPEAAPQSPPPGLPGAAQPLNGQSPSDTTPPSEAPLGPPMSPPGEQPQPTPQQDGPPDTPAAPDEAPAYEDPSSQ